VFGTIDGSEAITVQSEVTGAQRDDPVVAVATTFPLASLNVT
jgi:hypothetical protein